MSFLYVKAAVVGLLSIVSLVDAQCKAVPGSAAWPSAAAWASLNRTIGGNLIKPTPPGAVCHPDQSSYNTNVCPTVQTEWTTFPFHREDPVSSAWNNWSNDTCIPDPSYSCSGEGYPAYVVNASTAAHVAAGVKFAAANNIRLIVKGTGHDYMGRSSAPNSLSIWTRHIVGMSSNTNFKPPGCRSSVAATAITTAAGHTMGELYAYTDSIKQVIIGGMAEGVGIGGYLTGAGHSALSVSYGLAADNLLSLTLVTSSGILITANECQNTNYFTAFRGGGGSTYGVLISATVKTYPTPAVNLLALSIYSYGGPTEDWWDAMTYILTQYPYLSNNTISGYPYIIPTYPISATASIAVYSATFLDHLSPYNSTGNITAIFDPIISYVQTTWPSLTVSNTTNSYATFYQHFQANKDSSAAGPDTVLGSRLVGADALSGDLTTLKTALKGFTAGSRAGPFLLGGQGIANATPRGGIASSGVLPAWRTMLTHFTSDLTWTPQNTTQKEEMETLMTEKVQYLRDLAPKSGAYVNEANTNEPSWQTTFWGSTYTKLASIKKKVDPNNVFWCHPCVGNEGWEEVGDMLCKVGGNTTTSS